MPAETTNLDPMRDRDDGAPASRPDRADRGYRGMLALAWKIDSVELADVPLLRAFGSHTFRLMVAAIFVLLGIGMTVVRLTRLELTDPAVAFDFPAYYYAAERMLSGDSPYLERQLLETGVAYCRDCYLYPPVFAQALAPVALVPIEIAKVVWWVICYALAFASTWLATGIGGAKRTLERVLWCLAAVFLFGGVASTIWVGNVGTLVALSVTLVAMGGAAAGVGAAAGTLLKVQPIVFLPAVVAAGRRSLVALVTTFVIVLGAGLALAPGAWLDYPSVLRGVFSIPSESTDNLAPAALVARTSLPGMAVDLVRLATLAAAGVSIIASVWLARRPGGMPAAALAGTVAMLLIPGTLWFHYLAVLLPFAAMSWPQARRSARLLLLAGTLMISPLPFAIHVLPVYLGSTTILAATGWVLWPRARPA